MIDSSGNVERFKGFLRQIQFRLDQKVILFKMQLPDVIHSGYIRITQSHLNSSAAFSIEENGHSRGREKSLIF